MKHIKRLWRTPANFASACAVSLICLFLISRLTAAQTQIPIAAAPAIPSLRMHHVTLTVNDADSTSKWYVEKLGFTATDRFTITRPDGSKSDVVRIEIPGFKMNISKRTGTVPPNRRIDYQGWRQVVFEVDDVDKAYQLLKFKGVEFDGEPNTYKPPGFRVARFKDPEGNRLEIYQDI